MSITGQEIETVGCEPTVVTRYDPKPVPVRNCDWEATFEGYDCGDPIGFGATEANAIADLMEQIEERAP